MTHVPLLDAPTLTPEAIIDAGLVLALRRQHGEQGEVLPLPMRPQNLADAWAVQRAMAAHHEVCGWKCGLPVEGKPVAAPLFRSACVTANSDGVTHVPVFVRDAGVKVEQELAFVLGQDLPPQSHMYSLATLREAVAEARVALELIDDRYVSSPPPTFWDRFADGLVNQGLVLGPVVPLVQALSAQTLTVGWSAEGAARVTCAGQHSAGDPLLPLQALLTCLSAQGLGLKCGDVIITGAYAGAPFWPVGVTVRADFEGLASFEVCFSARTRQVA